VTKKKSFMTLSPGLFTSHSLPLDQVKKVLTRKNKKVSDGDEKKIWPQNGSLTLGRKLH
jgi:hypothetical protein